MDLAEAVYRLSAAMPREEMYGLTSQMRRAAASVPANIAEGYGRDIRGAYVQQLRVAQGSLKELETHVLLSQRVGFLEATAVDDLLAKAETVGRILRGLIRSLEPAT